MLKIAIIGCGKQADAHAVAIQSLQACAIVALCDTEELMARQLGERYNIKYCFTDIKKMLEATRPDVVHIINRLLAPGIKDEGDNHRHQQVDQGIGPQYDGLERHRRYPNRTRGSTKV